MKDHLVLFDSAFIKNLTRNVFQDKVDPFSFSLFLNVRKKTHFKLKGENINAGDAFFAALKNDLFSKEPRYRQVDRADSNQSPSFFTLKAAEVFNGLCPVGTKNEGNKILLLLLKLLLALLFTQVDVHPDIVRPLIFAKVEDFKSTVVLAISFQLPLRANEAFAGSMDSKLAEVGANPLSAKLFSDRECCTGTTKEIGNKVAFIG